MARNPIGFGSKRDDTAAVFVRVPVAQAERLDRASARLRRPKREIVAALLSTLDTADGGLAVGRHTFLPEYEPDVLTPPEAAALLRVDERIVRQLAVRGELPARRLGREWRFSRRALLDWLGARD